MMYAPYSGGNVCTCGRNEASNELDELSADLSEATRLLSEFSLLVIYPMGTKRIQTALNDTSAFLSRIKAKDAVSRKVGIDS
jgi:hypothetical protein